MRLGAKKAKGPAGTTRSARALPPTVMVTSAQAGFGEALVDAYAALGFNVIVLVRTASERNELEARHGHRVHLIRADITKDGDEELVRDGLSALDLPLDILVNNAHMAGKRADLQSIDTTEIKALFQVHCLGALRMTRAALPFLLRSAAPYVVNISSRIGSLQRNARGDFASRRYSYGYRIAKAAQNMLSLCLLEEFRDQGIRVLALHPGELTTVSASDTAALSSKEAAQMFVKFLESRSGLTRLPTLLQDTAGRTIPW